MDGSTHIETDADPIDIAVGRNIRAKRRLLGLSQEKLAEHLKLTFQQVQKYERGMNRISASKLVRTAQFLGCQPGELLPDFSSGKMSETPDLAVELAALTGGIDVARTFVTLGERERKAVAALCRALAGEDAG